MYEHHLVVRYAVALLAVAVSHQFILFRLGNTGQEWPDIAHQVSRWAAANTGTSPQCCLHLKYCKLCLISLSAIHIETSVKCRPGDGLCTAPEIVLTVTCTYNSDPIVDLA